MIRLIQRRLIIPRGDTGSFTVPVLTSSSAADISVFTIFDELTHRKIFQKEVAAINDTLTIEFSHGDTVNLTPGKYVWDIKFYKNPVYAEGELINGDEIDSYYAGFSLPVCEIRETGDDLLMADDAPTSTMSPMQINIINAAISEINQAKKEVASAANAAESAQTALEEANRVSQAFNNLATVATSGSYNDLLNKPSIPSKVSDLTDDSGHYTKPSDGIPASDMASAVQTSLGKADTAYQLPSNGIPASDLADGVIPSVPVQSVNSKTGAVVLSASDVGAGTYSKPSGGIPSSDMASAVQTSLGKADTAYQKPSGGIPAADLASGVIPTVPSASSATPQPLGTAAAGSSGDYARADHVHAKPTAADVGAIAAPVSPSKGAALAYNGSAWVAGEIVENVSGSTPSITAMAGVQYVCGEVSTLEIEIPASGCFDVVFDSGSTATALSFTLPTAGHTLVWENNFDPTSLDANTTYEINIKIVGTKCLGVVGKWT